MTLVGPLLCLLLAAPPPLAQPTEPAGAPAVVAGRLQRPDVPAPVWPTAPRRADGQPFTCAGYILADVATGQILVAHNPTARLYPASTTKIMTTLLALEDVAAGRVSLDDEVTVSKRAAEVEESGIWLTENEHISLHDLLVGVMVRSANDAAYMVAEYLGGGDAQAFVDRMIQRAEELGCVDTRFVNPHGLHRGLHREPNGDEHYSTPYDLLRITFEAWRHPFFRELCVMDKVPIAWENVDPDPEQAHAVQRILANRNKLLHRYDECVGVKTGYTRQAGACLVSAARRGNREVLAVTMKSPRAEDRWQESEALLRFGLDEFTERTLVQENMVYSKVPVTGGQADNVGAVAAGGVRVLLHRDESEPQVSYRLVPALAAPLATGLPLGWTVVEVVGRRELTVPLLAANDVPASRAGLHRPRPLGTWVLYAMGLILYGALAEAYLRRRDLFAESR